MNKGDVVKNEYGIKFVIWDYDQESNIYVLHGVKHHQTIKLNADELMTKYKKTGNVVELVNSDSTEYRIGQIVRRKNDEDQYSIFDYDEVEVLLRGIYNLDEELVTWEVLKNEFVRLKFNDQ